MAFYASWDSSVPSPSPVTGWFDTTLYKYPDLPSNRILVSDAIWAAKVVGLWAVDNGKLVPYTLPMPLMDYRGTAHAQLHESHDMVMAHLEVGNSVPQAIIDYRNALRAIAHHPEPVYAVPPKPPT